jgi:two-component system sensor histidine kinase AdeS
VVLTADALAKSLIEIASDNKLLLEGGRGVRFYVDNESLYVLQDYRVEADFDLLGQAVHNVLDNAFKYSYGLNTIVLRGAIARDQKRFFISVFDKGIPITADECRRAVERGWRSREAKWATGEGSGIGLWIVNGIMKAHGGEFSLLPTDNEGLTEARLAFPCSRR